MLFFPNRESEKSGPGTAPNVGMSPTPFQYSKFDVTAPTFIGRKSHRRSVKPGRGLEPAGTVPVEDPMELKPGLFPDQPDGKFRLNTRAPIVSTLLSKS